MKFKFWYLVLTIFTGSVLYAQKTGEVRGFVNNEKDGQPVPFATVFLKNTTYGANTDINGFFSLSRIPIGDYDLMVTSIGFDTLEMKIKVSSEAKTNLKLTIKEQAIQLKTVEISAEQAEKKEKTLVSTITVTPQEIKRMPSIGGEPDMLQYIQTIPGVVFTGDQGGQIYIRGGTPIQNKVIMDGAVIYNPFHSIGLFSVFDTDIIRSVNVYTGGFGAEYGGRISSIMDITTKDGNKKEYKGKISVNPFTSKVLLEGPIGGKEKDASFYITSRGSYLERSSKIFYPYIRPGEGLPYNFLDIHSKISFSGKTGSKFNVFGFHNADRVNLQFPSKLQWRQYGGGTNFLLLPTTASTIISGNFAYSNYISEIQEAKGSFARSSQIGGFNGALNFSYFIGKNEVKLGFEVYGFTTNYNFINALGTKINQEEFTTEAATFVKYKITKLRYIIEPSLRFHYYASKNYPSLEPRINAKYIVTEFLRVKLAGGRYSQNFVSANSDRDVVNLFQGYLSSPEGDIANQIYRHPMQIAYHAVGGFEIDITKRITLNIEGYYKNFSQVTNINRDRLFPEEPQFIAETGRAFGGDISTKWETKHYAFSLAYTIGKVDRTFSYKGVTTTYYPVFDRRHNLNTVASYFWGTEPNKWEVSIRWNLGSGFPFTQTQGFFEKIIFENITSDYLAQNGNLGILYAPINEGRLPYYHRMDASIKYTRKIGKTELEGVASVVNVYNRENIFYFDRIRYIRVNQLPFLPAVAINFNF